MAVTLFVGVAREHEVFFVKIGKDSTDFVNYVLACHIQLFSFILFPTTPVTLDNQFTLKQLTNLLRFLLLTK